MKSQVYDFSDQRLSSFHAKNANQAHHFNDSETKITHQMLNDVPLIDIHIHLPSTISPMTAWELGIRNQLITVYDDPNVKSGKNWRNGPQCLSIHNPYEHYSDIFIAHDGCIKLDAHGHPVNLEYNIDTESFKSFDRVLATIQGHRHPPGGIQTEDDLIFILGEYLQQCKKEKVIYSELQQNIKLAYTIYPNIDKLQARLKFSRLLRNQISRFEKHGIYIRFLHCFNKTQIADANSTGHERSLEAYEWLLEAKNEFPDVFVGIESAGHEKDATGWPAHLQAGYNKVAELKLGCEAHGGEGIGVEHMMDVVRTLPITRLAHGFQVVEDLEAVQEIRDSRLVLVMMPLVNLKLGAYVHGRIDEQGVIYPLKKSYGGGKVKISLHQHPFFELLRRHNIKITIGSDNPELVGKPIKESIKVLAGLENDYPYHKDFIPLTGEELYFCCKNGIEAAFCNDGIKALYLQQLDDWKNTYRLKVTVNY